MAGVLNSHAGPWARQVGPPPVPHEHGAWMVLYTPLCIVLAGMRTAALLPAVLLVLTVTAAFFGQNAVGLVIRRRGGRGAAFWLGVYLAFFVGGSVCLLWVYGLTDLLWIGLLAAGLFLRQTLKAWISLKRVDRSLWGEMSAVGGLALTAPAGYVVSNGSMDSTAWALWGGCTLYFISSVFYVKMLVSAATVKSPMDFRTRWRLGRNLLLYHLLLIAVVTFSAVKVGGPAAAFIGIAYAPVILRALWGWASLSNRLPSLRRIGVGEICYALWFAGSAAAGLPEVL